MKKSKIINEWVIPIVCTFALFMILRSFIFFTVVIPSESMLPTLQVNDRLITSRIFDEDKLERGDIVVFVGGGGHKHMHIKRIIGLSGDIVDLKENGELYVNGELLKESYVNTEHSQHLHCGCGLDSNHIEMKLGNFKVPEGKVFFLGDNRDASFDSRYWEDPYVDIDDIVGKPVFRIFPFNRFRKI